MAFSIIRLLFLIVVSVISRRRPKYHIPKCKLFIEQTFNVLFKFLLIVRVPLVDKSDIIHPTNHRASVKCQFGTNGLGSFLARWKTFDGTFASPRSSSVTGNALKRTSSPPETGSRSHL